MKTSHLEAFETLISQIRAALPNLQVGCSQEVPAFVSRQYSWKTQPGLNTDLHVSLQNDDEIHLCIGRKYWTEFRPVDDAEVRAEVVDRVTGFLLGDYRIKTDYFGDKVEQSSLQREGDDGEWECLERSILMSKTGWAWETHRVDITRNRDSNRLE